MEGMDRPDFGIDSEEEAWNWMRSMGLEEVAIRDDLDVSIWAPRFKSLTVRSSEFEESTSLKFQFWRIMYEYRDRFAWTAEDVSYTTAGLFDVILKDDTLEPVRDVPRRLTWWMEQWVREEMER